MGNYPLKVGIQVYEDRRLGGVPQMVYGDPRELMRLPEEILDCVVFLATKEQGEDESELRCRGTAFFVSVASRVHKDVTYPYLVTAKHNIAKVIEHKLDLFVRVNTVDDRTEDIRIARPWAMSSDPSVDLAVLPLSLSSSRYRYRIVSPFVMDQKRLEEFNLGIGDEVVISGLFTRRTGRQKNIPIVRFGNVAATPSEAIRDFKSGLDFHAYLIEVRSIGGLSGSPVFAYFGPGRIDPRGDRIAPLTQAAVMLIGVLRGHWEHKEPIPYETAFADETNKVNWGIATATPSSELMPILYSEAFVKQRNDLDQKLIERDSPVSDMADDEQHGDDKFTRSDFVDALTRATRKIEPK